MKTRALIVGALVLIVLVFIFGRAPHSWSGIASGMSRQDVYSRVGQPTASHEETSGFVFWRKNMLVGRWELAVAFHADDTVGVSGYRWVWRDEW